MNAIVFDLGITMEDIVEKPVLNDHLQVVPIKTLISGLENSIYAGLLWVRPETILGSTGLVKVNAIGLDAEPQLEGKLGIVLPFSKKYGGVGTEIDGILAEKSVIPQDTFVPIPSNYDDRFLLYPFVSIGLQLRRILRGLNVLIIGDGLTGLISANMIVGYANKVGILRDELSYKIKMYGIEEIKEFNSSWDSILITTMRSWARVLASNLSSDTMVVLPKFMNSWPVVLPNNNAKFIEPTKINGVFEYIENEISDKFFKEIIGLSNDLFSSIPSSKPGIIVDVTKSLFHEV